MPQRPEDYMSTKNVMGNRPGGTDARTNDPFSYLKTKPEHAYLGHFKNPKFLRAGHNVSAAVPKGRRSRDPARLPTSVRVPEDRRSRDPVLTPRISEPFRPSAPAAPGAFDKLARRTVRKIIRGGSPLASQARAERPVLAARLAGATASAVRAARQSPESARSERRAKRAVRRTLRTTTRAVAGARY
jgi:hypothetical protein